MDTLTFISIWILLSFPIVRHVNTKMEEANDTHRFKIAFQFVLFIRAQFEVPKWYLIQLTKLLSK
jgi:hypothetical protein